MPDVRLIILAATFALLIVTAVSFVSTLVRHRRMRKLAGPLQQVSEFPAGFHDVDTNLEGLDVPVGADAPSASLLTPLRTGEWMPPETPAPAEALGSASLSERIASFTPVPDIREPAHLQERHEDWMAVPAVSEEDSEHFRPVLGQSSLAGLTDESPKAPVTPRPVPLDALLPEVHPQPVAAQGAPGAAKPSPTDDFSAELRALLPEIEPVQQAWPAGTEDPAAAYPTVPIITPTPAPVVPVAVPQLADILPEVEPVAIVVPEPAVTPESTPIVIPELVPELPGVPELVPQPAPEPALAPEPAPTPVPAPEPAPSPGPAPESAPSRLPEPAPSPEPQLITEPEFELEPLLITPPAAVPATPPPVIAPVTPPAPAPVPATETPEFDEKEYWEDLLREQSVGAPSRPRAARPEVRVTAAEAPVVAPEPEVVVSPRPARPVARVRTAEGTMEEFAPVVSTEPDTSAPRSRAVPEIVMEAPVEMWFGEARVGVKAGTATYDRFRKYADVLLADLRSSKAAS